MYYIDIEDLKKTDFFAELYTNKFQKLDERGNFIQHMAGQTASRKKDLDQLSCK